MRVAAACASHFASGVPTPTLPQLPALPQQVWCITSFASTKRFSFSFSIERLVHPTSSHTVFNGRLHGKPMSIFKVSNILDVIHWYSDSVHFLFENCLRIQYPVHSREHGKVVGVMFRKEPSAKESDLDALKAMVTKMFEGTLPTFFKELLTQIDENSFRCNT
ncbi:hypothetical protein ACFX2J_036861 [Malus domestica]